MFIALTANDFALQRSAMCFGAFSLHSDSLRELVFASKVLSFTPGFSPVDKHWRSLETVSTVSLAKTVETVFR